MIILKSRRDLEKMARAGRVVEATLERLAREVRPGVTTAQLDAIAEETIVAHGGRPTFKGFRGFPASICASPNSMVVHGIPGPYVVRDGDILSLDVGVTLAGFVADSATTVAVGDVSEEARRLLRACEDALWAGIEEARVGNRVGRISAAVQKATESAGFTVIRSLVGHGVGRTMHEEPQVPNYGPVASGPVLEAGTTIAIEPMITAGTHEVALAEDGWSISTADGSLAAHFEHTVAVTDDGPRVLTLAEASAERPVASSVLR